MTEAIGARPEEAPTPTPKKKPGRKPGAKKPDVKQVVKNRSQAIGILRSMNTNTDETLPTEELIAIAEQTEPEKYYKIMIQERDDTEAPALIRVLGVPFRILRGVEVVVPARVVNVLKDAVTYLPVQVKDPITGKKKTTFRKKMTELFNIIGEVERP